MRTINTRRLPIAAIDVAISISAARGEKRGGVVTGTTTLTVAENCNSYTATASRQRPDGIRYTSTILRRIRP